MFWPDDEHKKAIWVPVQFLLSHFSAPKKYFAGLKFQELLFSLVWEKDTLLVWKSYLFTRFIPWLVRLRWMSTSKPEGWRWEPKASGRHLERKSIVALGYETLRFLGHYLPISCKTVAMMETSLRIIFTKSTFFFTDSNLCVGICSLSRLLMITAWPSFFLLIG